MKIKHYLLITVLLLGLIVTQVQAKGGPIAYKLLVDRVSPRTPLEMQSRQAFERMLPDLHDAQKDGRIVAFEPDFFAGILKVEYPQGTDISGLQPEENVFTDINTALQALRPKMDKQNADSLAAVYNPVFTLSPNSYCLYITGLELNDRVVGLQQDSSGKKLGIFDGRAAQRTFLDICFSSVLSVRPTQKLTFKVYNAINVLKNTYVLVVPAIKFTGLDKPNARINGSGPAGKPYSLLWVHSQLNASNGVLRQTQNGTISGTGLWSQDFGSRPIRGGDGFFMFVNVTTRFVFQTSFTAPNSICTLDSPNCYFYVFPNQAINAKIIHGGVTYPFSGKSDQWGFFHASLEDARGNPVFVSAGDTIEATGIAVWKILPMSSTINFDTDIVAGKAPPSRYLWVGVYNASLYPYTNYWWKWVLVNSSSNYTANYHAWQDLQRSNTYQTQIQSVNPLTGNVQILNQFFEP